MDLRLIYAIILTIAPVTELRVGLPLAITYALDKSIPVSLIFILIVLINILTIFLIFFFLDNLHSWFMKFSLYKKFADIYLKRMRKKADKVEKRYEVWGFLALTLFVSVPLPGTGAWTGSIVSWLLDLDRKKSVVAIAAGVAIAGILILFGTLGVINFLM